MGESAGLAADNAVIARKVVEIVRIVGCVAQCGVHSQAYLMPHGEFNAGPAANGYCYLNSCTKNNGSTPTFGFYTRR
jgi:hypothetical protein